jgi:hypothetical protein
MRQVMITRNVKVTWEADRSQPETGHASRWTTSILLILVAFFRDSESNQTWTNCSHLLSIVVGVGVLTTTGVRHPPTEQRLCVSVRLATESFFFSREDIEKDTYGTRTVTRTVLYGWIQRMQFPNLQYAGYPRRSAVINREQSRIQYL